MAQYKINDFVINFGIVGYVVGFKGEMLILENARIGRWVAEPEKCIPYNR